LPSSACRKKRAFCQRFTGSSHFDTVSGFLLPDAFRVRYTFAVVNSRCFLVWAALLLLLFTNSAFASGGYQRTKDRKTRVWNNYPQPGDAATWSGDRDADRYATGYGTLTWYIMERKYVTGSYLPTSARITVIRYSGNMVRGKLDGPVVNVDENGATFHGKFANGRRVGDWAAGPASSPSRKVVSKEAEKPQPPTPKVQRATADAPAEGSKPTPGPAQPASPPPSVRAVKATPTQDVDDSLKALVGPPHLLRTEAARPGLTAAEVIGLANAEARTQGYDLDKYQRPQAQYVATDNTWSVSYDQKNDAGEAGKPFSVKVEDKTKKTSIAAGK
jgi:hypothetical protein